VAPMGAANINVAEATVRGKSLGMSINPYESLSPTSAVTYGAMLMGASLRR
jgi:hypothetical protein